MLFSDEIETDAESEGESDLKFLNKDLYEFTVEQYNWQCKIGWMGE